MSNPASAALRSFLLLVLIHASIAGASELPATLRPIEAGQDRAGKIDAAETKAEASCAGHVDLIPGAGGELVADYRCTRAILHVCSVSDDTAPAVAFAVILNGESGFDTYDPERLLELPSNMGLMTTTWPRSIALGIPPYMGEGPHQEVYERPGDQGGRIDMVYLGAAKARSTITIIHFRELPAGHTTIFKGRCSVKRGKAAIRAFDKLRE